MLPVSLRNTMLPYRMLYKTVIMNSGDKKNKDPPCILKVVVTVRLLQMVLRGDDGAINTSGV